MSTTKRNRKLRNVQELSVAKASKQSEGTRESPKIDRRVLETRDILGDALVQLMQEKNFDDITVQNVLDRAGVGRSTFYVHYRDKNDLFLSDVEDFLDHFSSALKRNRINPRRLLPVAEFFSHVRDVREFHSALVRSGKLSEVWLLARGVFARSIDERLQEAQVELDPQLRSALAHALSGSFFSLLDWWIDKGMQTDPREMDALFHRLAWKGVAEAKNPTA